jgi:hypothetical protein
MLGIDSPRASGNLSSAKIGSESQAASFPNQYSWCKPPRTGLRLMMWPAGSRCRWKFSGGDRLSGAGMPGPRLMWGLDCL